MARFVIIRIVGGFVTDVDDTDDFVKAMELADQTGSGLRSYNLDSAVVFDREKKDVVYDGVGSDLPPDEREAQFK